MVKNINGGDVGGLLAVPKIFGFGIVGKANVVGIKTKKLWGEDDGVGVVGEDGLSGEDVGDGLIDLVVGPIAGGVEVDVDVVAGV